MYINNKKDSKNSYSIAIYILWLIIHVWLFILGDDQEGGFPYIHKNYTGWIIDFDIERYGFAELYFYCIIVPVVIFIITSVIKRIKNKNKESQI